MMTYKFYKAQVTGAGYMPQGDCQAILKLDDKRNPEWSDVSEEFQRLCLPWFTNSVRMGKLDNPEPLEPFSEEALNHLSKHQLPSQGFVMVKVAGELPKTVKTLPFKSPGFSPPPGIFKKKE